MGDLTIEGYLQVIGEVWLGEEYTTLDFHYEPAYYSRSTPDIIVTLKWAQEGYSPHHADWTEHHWSFYGDTVAEAFKLAAEWASELAEFKTEDD